MTVKPVCAGAADLLEQACDALVASELKAADLQVRTGVSLKPYNSFAVV
jgi:hypothetical protein